MIYSFASILCDISYTINLPKYLGAFGKNKIIVLMYHGITKSHSQNPLKDIYGYNISEKQFEDQMAYLSRHCNVIKASEAIAGENISLDKKNVVITFDDGYKNNYTNAFPILMKYNFPALFSIPTEFVVNRVPLWNDIIEYAVTLSNKKSVHIKWNNRIFNFRLDTANEMIDLIKWLIYKCTVVVIQEEREQFIFNVLKDLDVSIDHDNIFKDPDYEPLSLQEIKNMFDSNLAKFASHSVHHYILPRVNEDTLINELHNSKSAIENMTGSPCKYCCIPGGQYNKSVVNAILDASFEKIFTSDISEIDPAQTSYIIGRHCITRNLSLPTFVDIVHGPFHRISWKYNSLKSRK